MTTKALLISVILMTIITFYLRMASNFTPRRWLQSPILQSLNSVLPMIIMMILILNSLSLSIAEGSEILAKVGGLIGVVLSYLWLRNIFVSITLGILLVNLFSYLLV